MPEFCSVEREGHLLLVTIDRPAVLNALHPPANHELAVVFDEFAADPELWIAILTGAGDPAFSAGNDLKYQAAGDGRLDIPSAGFAADREVDAELVGETDKERAEAEAKAAEGLDEPAEEAA